MAVVADGEVVAGFIRLLCVEQCNYADTSKARRMLGWQAEVGLDDGLRRTVEWFVKRSG